MTSARLVPLLALVTTAFGCASVLGFDEGHPRDVGGSASSGASTGKGGSSGKDNAGGTRTVGGTVSASGGSGGTLTKVSSAVGGSHFGGSSFANTTASPSVGGALASGGTSTGSSASVASSGGTVVTTGGVMATGGSRVTSNSATGGAPIATGGVAATGGASATGGKPPTGGMPATGGFLATGCTGNFETFQATTGGALCVAKMVAIPGPSSNTNYSIDATEVTRGQYESWLASKPALGAASAQCSGNTSYTPDTTCITSSSRVCTGSSCDHHPQVCIDWCDAYQYCYAIGKRLCGNINGGTMENGEGSTDETVSQWYRACSSGGKNCFPYDGHNGVVCDIGAAYNASTGCNNCYEGNLCVDHDYWKPNPETTLPVGSMDQCQSRIAQYAGVYDLSGNVWEWEDSCKADGSEQCTIRGGGFDGVGFDDTRAGTLYCWNHIGNPRTDPLDIVGFRCCSR